MWCADAAGGTGEELGCKAAPCERCHCLSFLTVSSWQEITIASCTAVMISGSAKPVIFKLFILG